MKTIIKKACFSAVVMAALLYQGQKRYDRPADMTTSTIKNIKTSYHENTTLLISMLNYFLIVLIG